MPQGVRQPDDGVAEYRSPRPSGEYYAVYFGTLRWGVAWGNSSHLTGFTPVDYADAGATLKGCMSGAGEMKTWWEPSIPEAPGPALTAPPM